MQFFGGGMRPIFVALVGIIALAPGCAKKAEGQTVAVVNGEEITTADLNARLAGAKLPPGVDKAAARSQVLQSMIDQTLLAQEAKKEGIDKSPDFLNRERQFNDELLISMLAERKGGTTQLPRDSDVAQFEASHPQMFAKREIWSLDQLRFQLPPKGPLMDQIGKTKTLQELAKLLSSNNIAATPAKTTIDSSVVPQGVYEKIQALGPGEPFIIPVGNEAVASAIASRDPQPLVGDDAKSVAVNALRKEQTMDSLRSDVKRLRSQAKIEYKPGFAPANK